MLSGSPSLYYCYNSKEDLTLANILLTNFSAPASTRCHPRYKMSLILKPCSTSCYLGASGSIVRF